MKKLVVLAVLLVMATCISTSAFAWSTADLVIDNNYWLKYNNDGVLTRAYYGDGDNDWNLAKALNMSVANAKKSGGAWVQDGDFLGNLNTFCIDRNFSLETEGVAKYKYLTVDAKAKYILQNYYASWTDFSLNSAIQAAIWTAQDGTTFTGFKKWSVNDNDYVADTVAWDLYDSILGEVSTIDGQDTIAGFNGLDLNTGKTNQSLVPSVPEASTLVGFGSALLMAGPGMIGWLRRRK